MASDSRSIAIVGNLNVDQVVATVERFPEWNEELIIESSTLQVAGTAGYLALTAQGLGIDPLVVSTIGDDANGSFLTSSLRAAGIRTDGVSCLPGQETSLGIIFVGAQGQRSILTVLGAHREMTVDIAHQHDRLVRTCAEVILCGMYLLPQFTARHVTEYARMLRERGQVVVFDPSWDPAGWTPQTRAETLALLSHVDIYLPNDQEVCSLMGTATVDEAVAAIGAGPAEIVVKCGAEGARHYADGSVTVVEALPVAPHNTIGAGDIFDLGYLYARRQGWAIVDRLRFANALAGAVIVQEGARTYPGVDGVWHFDADARRGRAS